MPVLRQICAATLLLASGVAAFAQSPNPVCRGLEAQLASLDRGGGDRGDQQRRYEDAVNRQQFELDRLNSQARKLECGGSGLFSIFQNSPPQCATLTRQIEQTRESVDRARADLQRSGGNLDAGEQRRSLLFALGNNNCGPQYRNASLSAGGGQGRTFLDNLFGNNGGGGFSSDGGSTFRTICVRTCDGFYYPISFATNSSRFRDDEQACQRSCPASPVTLYTYRNPGEDVAQAVSLNGQTYSELPNAFRYRQQFDATCSCRAQGQSWADALKQINDNVEQGDVIVTEKSSKQMAVPRDAKGRPIATVSRAAATSALMENAKKNEKADKAAADQAEKDSEANRSSDGKSTDAKAPDAKPADAKPAETKPQLRSVGPQFIPVR
jgi:hypothetical protein